MINDSAANFWPIGLYVVFTTSLVSGDVRHPFSFEIYIALGSTHGPDFFPQGFISGLRDQLVYGSGIKHESGYITCAFNACIV